ncbi:sugar-phosphatase [Lacticaseibacillus baoqingensis]|uniref:Sugar-phosphatase n=1 Tax=Lacticaseibacillus baoqingensis TaxID=2486013 RepID=A0ABW4EBC6_9LACO|nr:sugar-phosphatase [Lacticaseibacillus baoqingensis]
MHIKLIAIDMDGTLLNEHNTLTPATIAAVKAAKQQGIKVVLCSGRPLTGLQQFFAPLGLIDAGDYAITFNGAMVQEADTGQVLLEHTLTYPDFRQLMQLAQDIGVHVHAEDAAKMYTPNADISKYTVREAYLVDMPLFYRQPETFAVDKQFAKVMLIDEPDLLTQAQKQIPQHFFDDYYFVHSEPYFLEALNKNANKGNAVMDLAKRLGYDASQVMAIGDQANDLPMIKAAGLGVAMGNAIPAVKAAAQVQTATNAQDGVAKAIRQWALSD